MRLLALVVAAACLVPLAASVDPAAASSSRVVIRKINNFRAHHGLRPLRVSGSLRASAKRYSNHLMRRDWFGHDSRIHASSRYRMLGEVLEIHPGGRPAARRAVVSWKLSPGHRAVLLNAKFRFIGAGRTSGYFNGRRATIWVVHFGRR